MNTTVAAGNKRRELAAYLTATGLIVAMLGLGLDIWLHSREGESLANEKIFALGNPGHVVFGAGLFVTAAGAVLALISNTRRRSIVSRLAAGVMVIVMASVLTYGFAAPQGHDHDALDHATLDLAGAHVVEDSLSTAELVALGLTENEILLVETSRQGEADHAHSASINVSAGELIQLGQEVATAKETGARYASIETALAEGYVQIVQDLPLIGAHFVNPRLAYDRKIELERPDMLIYTHEDGGWRLYALAYVTGIAGFEGATAPEGFAGSFDTWHWHANRCYTEQGTRITASRTECARIPGYFVERTGYILHFWVVDNPNGLFAHTHPALKGSREYIASQSLFTWLR